MHPPHHNERVLNEAEYHVAIAEFDRLWADPGMHEDPDQRMNQLIRLIEAYESSVPFRQRP
jgi:antitoxin component HigA of HigAB toxin-antitoxin module